MAEPTSLRPAVFLDRDGTLSEEVGYMHDLSMYSVFPWTGRAIRRLNECGLAVVVVTNQSAVGRGFFGTELVDQVHARLRSELHRDGAHIDAVYYCPHHPDEGCTCRKPQPGMLQTASRELGLEPTRSFMVGDRYSDIQAGASAGVRTILVLTGAGAEERARHRDAAVQANHVAPTLEEAVNIIIGTSG